jgi:hypothetical protein
MKIAIHILLLFLILNSCKEKQKGQDDRYFVIHQNDSLIKAKRDTSNGEVLMFFYGDYNFILNDNQTVYFYRANRNKGYCGTGTDNSKPKRLYLTPDSLTQISIDSLDSFLSETLKTSSDKEVLTASISSPIDTIESQAFPIITKYFRKNNIQRYAIRLLTEEERYVTEARLENKHYNPDSIEWETGFDSNLIPPVPSDIEK